MGKEDSDQVIKFPTGFSPDFFEDKIILNNVEYGILFSKRLKDTAKTFHGRGIIGIKTAESTHYKLFYGGNLISKNKIGLSPRSYNRILSEKNFDGNILLSGHPDYSPKAFFGLYWNHPIDATRIAFKLGLISLVLGVISILLTIYSMIG